MGSVGTQSAPSTRSVTVGTFRSLGAHLSIGALSRTRGDGSVATTVTHGRSCVSRPRYRFGQPCLPRPEPVPDHRWLRPYAVGEPWRLHASSPESGLTRRECSRPLGSPHRDPRTVDLAHVDRRSSARIWIYRAL